MEMMRIPDGYQSGLNLHDTQVAIKQVKDFFQQTLAQKLNLLRVSAPIFVSPSSGLNDNLNGVERPVSFDIRSLDENAEIAEILNKISAALDTETITALNAKVDVDKEEYAEVAKDFYETIKE